MTTSLVSIIIPIYNAAPYLVRTWESLASQTYDNLEILLIDDGSQDASLEIMKDIASRDKRVQVLHHDNQGASFTRNRGIEQATGDYIMFMDADDALSPYAVESLLQAAETLLADIAVGDVSVIHDNITQDWSKPDINLSSLITTEQAYNHIAHYEWWGPVAKLYKASFLKQFRFPKETLSEDYFLMVQMFHKAHICHQPGVIYAYLKREGSLSTTTTLTPRSIDEVYNTYNAWQYSKQHFPSFEKTALLFFTESIIKVAGISCRNDNFSPYTWGWSTLQKIAFSNSKAILFNSKTSWKLKLLFIFILLGKNVYKIIISNIQLKKKRILFLTHTLHGGGVEKSLKVLLSTIDFSKHSVTLYSLIKEPLKGEFPDFIHYGYIYESISKDDNILKIFLKKISNKIRALVYKHCSPQLFHRLFIPSGFDTEIAYIEGDCTRIISGSTSKKSKKLAWIHCDMNEHHWSLDSYRSAREEAESYSRFNHVCAVSKKALNVAKSKFSTVQNWELTPNIIPVSEIKRLSAESLNIDVFKETSIHLCYVGRLEHVKGVDRLLNAYKTIISNSQIPIFLHIVGDGSLMKSLQNYADEHNLNNVTFYGAQTNPYSYMKRADWLICPSRSEGYGLVLAESMIVGTPVIATKCAGTSDILNNGQYGILTENSTSGLIQALSSVTNDKKLHSYFKQQAKNWVKYNSGKNAAKKIQALIL